MFVPPFAFVPYLSSYPSRLLSPARMIQFRALFEITAEVAEPQVVPNSSYGQRRFNPCISGTFKGERLSGEMMPGGSDCKLLRDDGVEDLDVRVTLKADDEDGTLIFMKGTGIRHGPPDVMARLAQGEEVDPSLYYFRESIRFEAPPGKYEWLNKVLAIATGRRGPSTVIMDVYEVL